MIEHLLLAIYGVTMTINTVYAVASYIHGEMLRGFISSVFAVLMAWGFIHTLAVVLG